MKAVIVANALSSALLLGIEKIHFRIIYRLMLARNTFQSVLVHKANSKGLKETHTYLTVRTAEEGCTQWHLLCG
jgi:hypothetical protein